MIDVILLEVLVLGSIVLASGFWSKNDK